MEPAVRAVIDIVKESGGAPDCTVLGFGGRAPAMMAALANAHWRIVWITTIKLLGTTYCQFHRASGLRSR